MAAALTTANIPSEAKVGTAMNIAGTGFAATHAIVVTILKAGAALATWNVTSDGSGNWSFPGSFTPQHEGLYTISATDGTSTVTASQKVQQG
jgi:hypothetical protein